MAKATTAGVPKRVARLPRDKHGRPVPWFVAWIDGQPDFRVIAPGRIVDALRFGKCWVCGTILGGWKAFAIGPMCAINRVSAEPPAHRDCAIYSARHCPFLTVPRMRRRETGLPGDVQDPAGTMIRRNPGVAAVWVTRSFEAFQASGGLLISVGEPEEVLWFAEGRQATRAEVIASIDSGLPLLRAEAEADGPAAVSELEEMHRHSLTLLPAEEAASHG
jgi:hypothetical protein